MSSIPDALRAADAIADRFLAARQIPGLAYGVIVGERLVHGRGIGTLRVGQGAPPDADSVFRIASMTKSFTAATILGLRDDGLVSLDQPVATYVPDLGGLRSPTTDSPAITVRHLLTMASGLATDDPWGDRQQGLDLAAFAELLRGPLTFAWAPGTRYEYSNLGYGILGRVISNVAGAEYREVVRDRLLRPLGMTSTTYLRDEVPPARLAHGYLWRDDAYVEEPMDPYGALASMGGIFTSVRDLARWVSFFLDAYPPRDGADDAPLSRASRREMQTGQTMLEPARTMDSMADEPSVAGWAYGMGLAVEEDLRHGRIVGHSGGYPGFGSNMRWHPASGLGVVVLANHRYAPTGILAQDLLKSLLQADAVAVRRIRPSTALEAARRDVERLIERWDDGLAARLFAMNVELDEPLGRRRSALEALCETHGSLRPDPTETPQSETPLHVAWWLAGERGRARITIRLDPESPSRVQTFQVTSVPEPSPERRAVADAVVAAINAAAPHLPGGLALGPEVDRTALDRALRIAGARYAPVRLGPLEIPELPAMTEWRLTGPYGELALRIELDAASGLVTSLTIRPRFAPRAPFLD
jgi:CubicO group peptidase (beta-lactamase class C family)